ncbi:MAG: ComEC/Rec2 family competence protein [Candidatus Marinimicrobia bacterium]|nr:ComEC/Rec2 family competence protein [Candidatus Neomarinimicrobiota bacterium]
MRISTKKRSIDNIFQRTPVLSFLILFVIGIIIANYFEISMLLISLILALLLGLTFITSIKTNDYFFIIIIIFAGMLRLTITEEIISDKRKIENIPDKVTVQIKKLNTNPFYIKSYNCNVKFENNSFQSVLYLKNSKQILAAGKEYEISNIKSEIIESNNNPFVFDYRRYMEVNGITHTSKTTKNSQIVEKQIYNPFLYYSQRFRRNISSKIISVYGIKKGSLLNGFLLGLKKEIPENLSNSFKDLGISHLLAVSGLHVGFIVLLFYQLFVFVSIPKKTRIILILFLMFGYCYIIGFSASIVRASLMMGFYLVSPLFNRKHNALNSVASAGLILLLWNPMTFFDVGFQFSFSAVFGIILIYSRLKRMINFNPKIKIIEYIYNLILVSFCAALATAPLSIYYFDVFNSLAIFVNIIFIPLTFLILSSTIITLPFLYSTHFSANLFINGLDALITLFLKMIQVTDNFSYWTIHLSEYKAIFITGVLIIFILILVKKSNFRKYLLSFLIVLAIVITIWNKQDEVITFSLEKGKSVLIKNSSNSVLINTGNASYFNNDFEKTIKPVMDKLAVKKITVIVTKISKDRAYNLEKVLHNYEVENIYSPEKLDYISDEKVTVIKNDSTVNIGKTTYDFSKSTYYGKGLLNVSVNLHNKNLLIYEHNLPQLKNNTIIVSNTKRLNLEKLPKNSELIYVTRQGKSKVPNVYNLNKNRAKRCKLIFNKWISLF